MGSQTVPLLLVGPLVATALGALVCLEHFRPLRSLVEPKGKRVGRNLLMAALGVITLELTEFPAILALSTLVEQRGWGLLNQVRFPVWLEMLAAFLMLDYTLYLWHMLTHRVPFLWRFHLVHHADLDLDASTGLRFHAGELLLSVPWRAGQVLLIGVSPLSYSLWQLLLFLCVLFHHSNVSLPIQLERCVVRVLVTPRMHGIHHSVVGEEMNSNWSSGLSFWDRLHGTLRLNVPQNKVAIGVPGRLEPESVLLQKLLGMPFGHLESIPQGKRPESPDPTAPRHFLLT